MSQLPKMTLAFVIRRCIMELGHPPNAREFADWANRVDRDGLRPFGRPINDDEASLMLKNQDRVVSARSAEDHERHVEQHELPSNVISISAARAQFGRRQRGR